MKKTVKIKGKRWKEREEGIKFIEEIKQISLKEPFAIKEFENIDGTVSRVSPLMRIGSKMLDFELSKYFKVSDELNYERASLLLSNDKFLKDIQLSRKKISIPDLDPKTDIVLIEDFGISNWLESSSQAVKNRLDQRIKRILKKYYLPINFYDWLESYLLYNREPYGFPIKSMGALWENFERLNPKLPLTTGEKKFLKEYLRQKFNLKTKGRLPKKMAKAYKVFLENLSKIKNTKRRLRNMEIALRALDCKKCQDRFEMVEKYGIEGDPEEKLSTGRPLLKTLAEEIAEEKYKKPTKLEYKKTYRNLRQAKRRFPKQAVKRFKREN